MIKSIVKRRRIRVASVHLTKKVHSDILITDSNASVPDSAQVNQCPCLSERSRPSFGYSSVLGPPRISFGGLFDTKRERKC